MKHYTENYLRNLIEQLHKIVLKPCLLFLKDMAHGGSGLSSEKCSKEREKIGILVNQSTQGSNV